MSKKIGKKDILQILTSVKKGEIKKALSEAKRCVEMAGLWESLDLLSTHERTYRAMIQYMSLDMDSEERNRSLYNIKEDLLRIADKLLLKEELETPRPGLESSLYTAAVRTRQYMSSSISIEKLLTDISASSSAEDSFSLIDELFTLISTTQHLTPNQTRSLDKYLKGSYGSNDVKAMILSALGLANLYYYDTSKLLLLLSHISYEDAQLRARRLTGIYLTLWRHPSRIGLSKEIELRIKVFLDTDDNMEQMRKVSRAILSARDTQRINEKVQQDIISELQKLQSDLRHRFPNQADLSDILNPEKNPEWEDLIKNSSLSESLKELGDIQAEGGDVMMTAFSNLKNFSFFRKPGNWLLPFDSSHPDLNVNNGINKEYMEMIADAADFLCDADKYSLALAMNRMPESQGKIMLEQMKQQFAQYIEDKKTSFSKDTESEMSIQTTLYIRSLSRLVNLFPHPGLRLPNPFKKSVIPMELPFIGNYFSNHDDLEYISEFLFSRGYYDEALPLLLRLESIEESSYLLLEKIGFALQNLSRLNEALEYYLRVEDLATHPSVWLLKKIASIYHSQGKHSESAIYWQRLSNQKPDDTYYVMQLANALYDAGEIEEALKNYYKADYLRGSSEKTWRPIAWCEYLMGNYEKSQLYYDRLLTMGDLYSDLLNAGHLALARGRIDNAIELYRRAAVNHPEGLDGLLKVFISDSEILQNTGIEPETLSMLADKIAYMYESPR